MAIKTRTKKTSPNTAGIKRGHDQDYRATTNRIRVQNGELTPWQISKHKRAAARRKRKFVTTAA